MKKVLIGMIIDGKAGGIDKYLMNFFDTVKGGDVQVDFLANRIDPELKEQLAADGAGLYCVSGLRNPKAQYQQVCDLIRHNGYDIVYMNISTAMAYPVLQAAHDCGVKKVIAHSHASGVDAESRPRRWLMKLLHNLCKGKVAAYATHHLACSEKAARWMFPRKMVESGKVETVFNSVDTSLFRPDPQLREYFRQELGLVGRFVIGHVGNASYPKNQLFLLRVFRRLLRREKDARLVIIGDGVRMERLRAYVKKHGLEESVQLLGRVDVSLGYMNAFDVFALPSKFEGLGIVLIEAQCTGVPCVASTAVPQSACVSNIFRFVPLSVNAWVDALLKWKHHNRADIVYENRSFSLSEQAAELHSILALPEEG